MRYLPHTANDIEAMLSVIGKQSCEELFSSIPQDLRLTETLRIPDGLSEWDLKNQLLKRSTQRSCVSFLGAGAAPHFVPEWVSQQLLRAEWYTSYTPYQPEVSQGNLQATFEFQSIVSGLFGLEIANASMYDGATAMAEGLLMASRLKKEANTVFLSKTIHPEYRETCHTYLRSTGMQILEVDYDENGVTDLRQLNSLARDLKPTQKIAAVAYQTPNFFGALENQRAIIDIAHQSQALVLAVTTDVASLGLLESPGYACADIAVGDGLGFVGGISLGGPGVGLFACKKDFVRQLPGRLCGFTSDEEGKPGFVLTLSTREQHIRRERATSNICTNHNLMALAFSMTLSGYGQQGFKKLSQKNIEHTAHFRSLAQSRGLKIAFSGPHFNETVLRFDDEQTLQRKVQRAKQEGIYAGVSLGRFYPELSGHLLVCTTELHSAQNIQALIDTLSQ